MGHIVLLGDSVFDNASHVGLGDEVIETLRDRLEPGWQASLLAQDGAVLADVARQTLDLPLGATHVMISAGGNDALGFSGVLRGEVDNVEEAIAALARVRREFERRYQAMLEHVLAIQLPTTICTIYDALFPDRIMRENANTALALLNDIITREAGGRGLPLLDLRVLFDNDADFANAIEPSAQGGEKLARSIVDVVRGHEFTSGRSSVFAVSRER